MSGLLQGRLKQRQSVAIKVFGSMGGSVYAMAAPIAWTCPTAVIRSNRQRQAEAAAQLSRLAGSRRQRSSPVWQAAGGSAALPCEPAWRTCPRPLYRRSVVPFG